MLRGIAIEKDCPGPFRDDVVLDSEDRQRRRFVLRGMSGMEFLLDLAGTPDLREGDGIRLSSGEIVRVRASDEPLMEIHCAGAMQLARIAWHVGNRHLAVDIGEGTLRLRADPVIAKMIEGLGGTVRYLNGPFNPEGGAYGNRAPASLQDGMSHAHSHGHDHG